MSHLIYTLQPETLPYPNGMILQIELNDSKQLPVPCRSSYLIKLADGPDEKKLLEHLFKEEVNFQNKKSNKKIQLEECDFKMIHISFNQTISVLKLLANLQKLYFQQKELVIDLFSQTKLTYVFKAVDATRYQLQPSVEWRTGPLQLADCDFLGKGSPCWFVQGYSLKLLPDYFYAKYVDQLLNKTPWILTTEEKDQFLKELKEEFESEEQLPVKFEGGETATLLKTIDPYPVLILKDKFGAFADLFMEYGSTRFQYGNPQLHFPSEKKGEIERNKSSEKSWEKDLLETDFIEKKSENSSYYCPLDKVAKSLTFLLELGWKIYDIHGKKLINASKNSVQMDINHQKVVLKGKMTYDQFDVDIKNIIGSFNRRERFIELGEGSIGLIPDSINQLPFNELTEELEWINDQPCLPVYSITQMNQKTKTSSFSNDLKELEEKLSNFSCIEDAPPSIFFKGSLRPYQQYGVNWLSFLQHFGFHGILADEMGLGKTIQVLAFLSRREAQKPHLIIMPTTLLFNWKNEIERFLPSFSVYLHQGVNRLKNSGEVGEKQIILTSYTVLRLDFDLFANLEFESIILDEAQTIKNSSTILFELICQLKGSFRLSLTGTPLENNYNEIWSHFHFLMPSLLGSLEDFQNQILASQADSRYLSKIRKKIAPFILKRKKVDVQKELPERIEQVVWIEMEEEEQLAYDRLVAMVKGSLLKKIGQDGIGKHRVEIFESILRLRQFCCHPLLLSSLLDANDATSSSTKMNRLFDDLETIISEGKKALVYSQFTSALKIMTKYAREENWNFLYLDGASKNREEIVTAFQEDSKINLFFVSLKAGGVGLNLTAADYVFIYDPWWNNAVEEQAITRAHRSGRNDVVIAKKFICKSTIEERIFSLKSKKEALISHLFDESDIEKVTSGESLTAEDLYFLLN